jgi:hypothetical protein
MITAVAVVEQLLPRTFFDKLEIGFGMNLGKRLGIAFEMCGVRAPEVARAANVPVATINALLRRGSKRSEYTEKILAYLPRNKVNHEWVRTGQGKPEPLLTAVETSSPPLKEDKGHASSLALAVQPAASASLLAAAPLRAWEYQAELPAEGGWVFIPKLGVVRSVLPGGKEEIKTVFLVEEVQAFRAEWIREDQLKPASLVWAAAPDASMAKVIYQGDSYVIDTSDTTPADGRAYSVWYSGGEHVRRIFTLPNGGLRLKPESDDFQSFDLSAEEAKFLRIIGRVVHRAGKGGL